MKKLRYIIVDDEPLAHKIIQAYAEEFSGLKLVGQAYSATEAIELLRNTTVNVMFLDIEMPKLKGTELLESLPQKPVTIFTTAYEEFALKGYELGVVDYLLKPFSLERFTKAINKVYDLQQFKITSSLRETNHQKSATLFIKSDKTVHQVAIDTILYLQSDHGYVQLFLENHQSVLSTMTLSELEEKLPSNFIRIHRSYMISLSKLKKLEGNQVTIGDLKLPVGRMYKKQLIDQLNTI